MRPPSDSTAQGIRANPFWRSVLSLVILGMVAAMPVEAAETGIRGTVLWGPVKPGPSREGQSDEEPLRATFHVMRSGREVTKFSSDKQGRFEVSLPPGDYVIVPTRGTPIPVPQSHQQAVSVAEEGFTEITLRLDSGMR